MVCCILYQIFNYVAFKLFSLSYICIEIFPRIKISLLVALMCQSVQLEAAFKQDVIEEAEENKQPIAAVKPIITISSHNTSDDG